MVAPPSTPSPAPTAPPRTRSTSGNLTDTAKGISASHKGMSFEPNFLDPLLFASRVQSRRYPSDMALLERFRILDMPRKSFHAIHG